MDEIQREENLMRADIEKTALKKKQFIREIKSGLGERIKENGNKVIKIKRSRWRRIINYLKNIF